MTTKENSAPIVEEIKWLEEEQNSTLEQNQRIKNSLGGENSLQQNQNLDSENDFSSLLAGRGRNSRHSSPDPPLCRRPAPATPAVSTQAPES